MFRESRESAGPSSDVSSLEQSAVKGQMNWMYAEYYVACREKGLVCRNTVCVGLGVVCVRA